MCLQACFCFLVCGISWLDCSSSSSCQKHVESPLNRYMPYTHSHCCMVSCLHHYCCSETQDWLHAYMHLPCELKIFRVWHDEKAKEVCKECDVSHCRWQIMCVHIGFGGMSVTRMARFQLVGCWKGLSWWTKKQPGHLILKCCRATRHSRLQSS